MATYFCDSSALAKRYITETGSAWLTATLDPKLGNFVLIARTHLLRLFQQSHAKNSVNIFLQLTQLLQKIGLKQIIQESSSMWKSAKL